MNIALLADIHGNYPALEAVLEDIGRHRPDRILVLGDLVFKGPQPGCCVDAVRSLNTVVLQGNIDELVGKAYIQPGFAKSPEQEEKIRLELEWTRSRLNADQLNYLAELPFRHTEPLGGGLQLHCVHANPQNLLDVYQPADEEDKLRQMFAGTDAGIVAYAHIHLPFVRYFGGRALLNTGSTGLPFDGDPRASYALLRTDGDDYEISIRRVRYDVERTVQAYEGSGHPFADSVIQALRTGSKPA